MKTVLALAIFLYPILSFADNNNVGFKRITIGDRRHAAIWYPTTSPESVFPYQPAISGRVAFEGLEKSGKYPIILFSHGSGGCSVQSTYLEESWARNGYIVAAPDHRDALCDAFGKVRKSTDINSPDLFAPHTWTSKSYLSRKNDLTRLLKLLEADKKLKKHLNLKKVALAGHSLGGYTAYGIAGGWPTWSSIKVKALLLLSPYLYPWLAQNIYIAPSVPVHFQGGGNDELVTISITADNGAYAQSQAAKELLVISKANHYAWTDLLCTGVNTVKHCLKKTEGKLSLKYSLAFFNASLKGKPPLSEKSTSSARFVTEQ